MRITITKTIGKSVIMFEIDGDKTKDALYHASNFTTIPEVCGLCKSQNLVLDGNKAISKKDGKSYTYVKIKCLDCNGRSTMGENMDGVNVFWKEFEKYEKPTEDK